MSDEISLIYNYRLTHKFTETNVSTTYWRLPLKRREDARGAKGSFHCKYIELSNQAKIKENNLVINIEHIVIFVHVYTMKYVVLKREWNAVDEINFIVIKYRFFNTKT